MTSAIKIASFNLRRDSFFAARSRVRRWEARRELVARMIRDSGAAIVGVQEMLPSMKEDILARLRDYSIFGSGRTKKRLSEHSAILLRGGKAKARFSDTFWLSKHPEKSGSRAYFSMFPRICTVCEAYVEEWGRTVRVFNTHFDHICAPARTLSVRIILDYMHRLNKKEKLPTILMGDMNAHPDSKPIRILSENRHGYGDIRLTNIFSSPQAGEARNTYHGFKGKWKGTPIDYIFVSEEFEVDKAYVDTSSVDGRYPSDHYPLVAVLRLKEEAAAAPAPAQAG
ncbi:MAG TPA: endonuclease/exonuclease/phosphatase family protein [Firmicutes bacterium]|nr:endonuclease/exonuclease/phosphatase family protein [Bacillota bacterium]